MAGVNLVGYSSSDSSDGEKETESVGTGKKRKLSTDKSVYSVSHELHVDYGNESYKLPSPVALQNMFKSTDSDAFEHIDDPSLHLGRVRSFAHERGNWASYVSIPCSHSHELLEMTNSIIELLKPSVLFQPVDDLHISLSKTFVLLHHWILPLVQDLKKNLSQCSRGRIKLCSIELYCNEEHTRTFLGLTVVVGRSLLQSYVAAVNKSLKQYCLPEYYEKPKFHVSLAWALGDVQHEVNKSLLSPAQSLVDEWFAELDDVSDIQVNHLRLKTGNKIFLLELPVETTCSFR